MLVHEMVHHLQNLGKFKYACPHTPNSDRESGFHANDHVRFTPKSGHVQCKSPCRYGPIADIAVTFVRCLPPLRASQLHTAAEIEATISSVATMALA